LPNRHQNATSFGFLLLLIALMVVAPAVGGHAAASGENVTIPQLVDAGRFDHPVDMHAGHEASAAHAATPAMTTPSPFCSDGRDHTRHGATGGCGAIGCAFAALIVTSQVDEGMGPRSLDALASDTIAAHSPDDWFRPPRTA
jgi:hypothetical protein